MKIFTLLALVLSLGISYGYAQKLHARDGLKVRGDYKVLPLIIDVDDESLITREEIKHIAKLKFLSFNIRTSDFDSKNSYHYLHLSVHFPTINDRPEHQVVLLDASLEKASKSYGVNYNVSGILFTPSQPNYSRVIKGSLDSKPYFLKCIEKNIERFIIDYLEANMP